MEPSQLTASCSEGRPKSACLSRTRRLAAEAASGISDLVAIRRKEEEVLSLITDRVQGMSKAASESALEHCVRRTRRSGRQIAVATGWGHELMPKRRPGSHVVQQEGLSDLHKFEVQLAAIRGRKQELEDASRKEAALAPVRASSGSRAVGPKAVRDFEAWFAAYGRASRDWTPSRRSQRKHCW